tara:strand:- start:156 stop:830 length:675 start_codon:yes stop_codon:yes gene_type:complete
MSLIIKKPQILYAPMLGTLGGGSIRSFGRGAGGGSTAGFTGNEVGYYNTTFNNATMSWFSAGQYGYYGIDDGPDYKFTAGQDLTLGTLRYKGMSSSNSFYVLVFEHVSTGSSNRTYDVHYGFRVDSTAGQGSTALMTIANSPQTFGNPVIPATGDYYLGWRSGVPTGVGLGSSGNLYSESSTNQTGSVSHWMSSQGSSGSWPYAGERIVFNQIDQQDYIALRIE